MTFQDITLASLEMLTRVHAGFSRKVLYHISHSSDCVHFAVRVCYCDL
jgi:hypothetical protein